MSLRDRTYLFCSRYLPFLRLKPPHVDRSAVLTLRPARNSQLTWERESAGSLVLTVPQNQRTGVLTRWLAARMKVPDTRKVVLDEVGAHVWELCDGRHTVDAIVQATGREYKMHRREAEVSVTMFLQMLHERKYIGFYTKAVESRKKAVRA